MKRSAFAVAIQRTALVCGVATIAFVALNHFFAHPALLTLAITAGTTFYHFAIRLAVGALIPNRFDPGAAWFQPMAFEARLYKKLQVRKWKMYMPTYDPRLFSLQDNTPEQIVQNMCQAEVVHEVIILCSFIPLLFSLLWGDFAIFLITSVLSAGMDLIFVIMQRYNRPRLVKILESKKELSIL